MHFILLFMDRNEGDLENNVKRLNELCGAKKWHLTRTIGKLL